ncbi:3',5'-cyclic adenosine monophosphate phosphodiesterase CpdA [Anaerotignum neopropionicum]|uniref:3',5'-cyclic adenosine monophosphate phosphodiesterase CpdA n=1 Tax=Anaerotignum neopropionicum TaxID=36847 RepID=A0A136WAW5_9FIRM|nr:metallophosphoesterase [Anaerotignum neopropionicum]KXL51660.1 3',5'-cyclic adenosine monophosphate phosphodiesterase CpdA [Anaerotignum neopropionicum]
MKKRVLSVLLASSMAISLALFTSGCGQKSSAAALWEAGSIRNKIVVISDIHIGIDDQYAETVKNRPLLIEFLQKLQRTKDVRELVIDGDFLDEWFLPVDYSSYTDVQQFYKDVIANNQGVIDELNKVADSGIKLVYIPGNHDMTQENDILQEAIPKIVQIRDAKGLGTYYTGDRNEIVIEHGHRYDVFSAPDTVTNAELVGNSDTILPAGYFYARYAATWVLEGRPKVEKNLPVVTNVPDKSDIDQYGAFMYYYILKSVSERMTPNEGLDEKIFDMHMAGFDDAYTYLDFYPAQQADGTISAPVLFKNIQRTWDERQKANQVKVPNSFLEAVAGTVDWEYYFRQAKAQHLENLDENVDVVVFGHTHAPSYRAMDNGKYYINDGTWIDHNTDYPDTTRTFAVITTGDKTTAGLYMYEEDGSVTDIAASVSGDRGQAAPATNSLENASFDYKAVENYGDDDTQARYVEVSGLTDTTVQEKLNQALKEFCLAPISSAEKDTNYDIMPVFEMVGGDLLSIRTYNTAYTPGAAYPVSSIRTQLFSLTTGDKDAGNLWDFIKDKDAFKQLVLDGKFGFAPAGVEGEIPKELKTAVYQKLAQNIDAPEFATKFYFGDGGNLNVWCEGDNHVTGDYWLFDIPVIELEGLATNQLLSIIENLKNLSN